MVPLTAMGEDGRLSAPAEYEDLLGRPNEGALSAPSRPVRI
jgi:hypothetical protein